MAPSVVVVALALAATAIPTAALKSDGDPKDAASSLLCEVMLARVANFTTTKGTTPQLCSGGFLDYGTADTSYWMDGQCVFAAQAAFGGVCVLCLSACDCVSLVCFVLRASFFALSSRRLVRSVLSA